jgi:hypothetical protein
VKKYERIAALFLMILSVTTGQYSIFTLKLGSMQLPAAGFMPLLASAVLFVASFLWLLGALGQDPDPRPFWEARGWLKPLLAAAVVFAYAFIMDEAGYLLSTLVFMLSWQFIIEREKPVKAAIIAVVTTLAMWLLFSKLLNVQVPAGILPI